MPGPGPGRPPKYSPVLVDTILKALRMGNTRRTAAGIVGVNEATLWEWMWGRSPGPGHPRGSKPKPGLANAVEQAEQEATAWYLSRVRIAAQTDPKSAQWWLERKGGFIKSETIVHEGNPAAPIHVESKVTVDGPSDPAERLATIAKTLDLLSGVGLLAEPTGPARVARAPRAPAQPEVD